MRDDFWLNNVFEEVWNSKFSDVKKKNYVFIKWKGKWKNKFGHIKNSGRDTEIAINSLFKDERVPKWVIELTIAHEIVHYMHGFHSPYPRRYRHPHKGGIVNKELRARGYGSYLGKERYWFENYWWRLFNELVQKKESGRVYVRHLRSSIRYF